MVSLKGLDLSVAFAQISDQLWQKSRSTGEGEEGEVKVNAWVGVREMT